MTSPSAAHTGHVPLPAGVVLGVSSPTSPDPDDLATILQVTTEALVDAGHASWCPVCGGVGVDVVGLRMLAGDLQPVTGTCPRCRGGRLNPFHGCTFTTDDPCACTTRCQAYRPTETPTP